MHPTTTDPDAIYSADKTTNRLSSPWVWIGRVLWILLFSIGAVMFIQGVPVRADLLSAPCRMPEECIQLQPSIEGARLLQDMGFSLKDYGLLVTAVEIGTALIFGGSAVLIFWRRSDERMALYTSVALLLFGTGATSFLLALKTTSQEWGTFINLWQIIAIAWFIPVFYIFPNGHLYPKWVIWPLIMIELTLVPLYFSGQLNSIPYISVLMLASILGLWTQVHRYRRKSGPVERQQTKWVVLGFASFFTGVIMMGLPPLLFPQLLHPINVPPSTLYDFIYLIPYNIVFAFIPFNVLPVTFSLSMLRSRLWDVDPIINRSLVYAGLTVILGAVFTSAYFGLHTLLENVLGGDQAVVAASLSAGAVVGLFSPSRKRLRRFVDKRFYGIALDYREAIKEYDRQGRRVRSTSILGSFGKYQHLELLGRGGMGEVYLGIDPSSHKKVAIKLLPETPKSHDEIYKRFMREAQIISALKHENIVALYDFGEQDGIPYMLMEYIDGRDLSLILMEKKRLPLDEAVPILRDIAAAVDYAHNLGIIHRDIKPGNVMVDGERVVLMDFGIAHIASAMTQLTGTGGFIGTLDYISPEQIQGASEVDGRADIYSLGVMAYQMLSGSLPFEVNNPGGLVVAHLLQPAPDIRQVAPEIPASASAAIQKAMAKRPANRFDTARAFVDQLTQ